MSLHFAQNPIWSPKQKEILDSPPNLIVSGCPGSGKTLLACHIAMRHDKEKSVAILVFTKSLRTFIRQYIDSFGFNDIEVLYEYQWRRRNYPKYDIIIVDEFQDFSLNEVNTVINNAKKGVYLFGDWNQQMYYTNFRNERVLTKNELLENTNLRHIHLNENYRISEENLKLIGSLFGRVDPGEATFQDVNSKPQFLRFNNNEEELLWISDFLVKNMEYKNIGILLKRNDGFKGGYFLNKIFRKDHVYGILDLKNYLQEKDIIVGYKYKSDDQLVFNQKFNINIMTFHSSKGLQFDCIIIPFANFLNHEFSPFQTTYIALSRTNRQIFITYSGIISEEYFKNVPTTYFNGEMRKQTDEDIVTKKEVMRKIVSIDVKNNLNKIYSNLTLEEYLDSSDCDIIKYDKNY